MYQNNQSSDSVWNFGKSQMRPPPNFGQYLAQMRGMFGGRQAKPAGGFGNYLSGLRGLYGQQSPGVSPEQQQAGANWFGNTFNQFQKPMPVQSKPMGPMGPQKPGPGNPVGGYEAVNPMLPVHNQRPQPQFNPQYGAGSGFGRGMGMRRMGRMPWEMRQF